MFDEAIEQYFTYEETLRGDPGAKRKVQKRISECNYGYQFVKNAVWVDIENIDAVNSIYPDYAPLITADESRMIFTSRRENTTGGKRAPGDNQFFEDIYFADNMNGRWRIPQNAQKPLNTKDHDSNLGISPDGTKLLTYHWGNIYLSLFDGESSTEPGALSKTINSNQIESSNNMINFLRVFMVPVTH